MKKFSSALVITTFVLAGCSTSTRVKLPENANVQFDDNFKNYPQGNIERRPFFWSSAGGIPYKVEKNGEVLSQGRLHSSFRIASIFWPPYALIYWPMGFGEECYDLTGAEPAACAELDTANIK
jgi:hypothetical protein